MKLAFLGDIHGNLAALEAVLREVRKKPVDAIFHVGDVVGYGPHPREVIDLLRREGIEGVRGNHDDRVATGFPVPVGDATDDSIELATVTCRWTRERLGPEELNWIARQPFIRTLSSGRMTLAIFHAHPIDMLTKAHEARGDDFFHEMASYTGADVNVFAHTHRPFWRVVGGRWFVNAGSVGFPGDDNPNPAVVQVELNGGAAVRIQRVDYDRARTATAVHAAGLPAGILRLLGTA